MNKHLEKIAAEHESIKLEEDGDLTLLSYPWNDPSIIFEFEKYQVLKPVRHIKFPEELVAIYHSKKDILEFIFMPLGEDRKERGREFMFQIGGEIESVNLTLSRLVM